VVHRAALDDHHQDGHYLGADRRQGLPDVHLVPDVDRQALQYVERRQADADQRCHLAHLPGEPWLSWPDARQQEWVAETAGKMRYFE
jgi:hypothetical protein